MARSLNFMAREGTAARLLPWVIAIMVLLSGLAVALGAALFGSMRAWEDATARSITVQIVSPEPDVLEAEAKAAEAFLRGQPNIIDIRVLPQSDTASLLAPWLGSDVVDQNLPLPRMIDASIAPGATVDLGNLAQQLTVEAPHARLDSYADWLANILDLTRTIQFVALGVIVVVAIAMVAITVFATLSRLASQRDHIELVHLIGAKDSTIAREFQWKFLWIGIKGGIIGIAFLVIVVSIVMYYGQQLDSAMLPDLKIDWWGMAILASLPIATGIMTMLTARITALRVLAGHV
jgi:cell division transport system permease protein